MEFNYWVLIQKYCHDGSILLIIGPSLTNSIDFWIYERKLQVGYFLLTHH